LNLSHDNCHLVGNDVLVLAVCNFSSLVLLDVELYLHIPRFVFSDFVEDSLVLTQVIEAAVDLHDVLGKSRLGYESISDQFLPNFQEVSIPDILLPNSKYFSQSIAFEEGDVGDNVEEC
jgi:hypothetical protein